MRNTSFISLLALVVHRCSCIHVHKTMTSESIAEFYQGRSVFITGATGFMGKVLVEKLLRSCPAIGNVYLLMRPSKGMDVAFRLQEFTNCIIFDTVKKQQPGALKKIVSVTGDVTLPGFGLSVEHLQLLVDNVTVVFNVAATTKFDETLRKVIEMNVKGPRELLKICHQIKNLETIVHVSTAYNNFDGEEVKEEIHPCKVDVGKLINQLDSLDDDAIKIMTNEIIGNFPNTYSYSKALAEQLVMNERGMIPLAIVRPTIVTPALMEPLPGWVESLNGPTGNIAGVGKGFIRISKIDKHLVTDIIPVDYPINLMIAVGWYTASRKPRDIVVYTCGTGHQNPITWKGLNKWGMKAWMNYPTKDMLWYPSSYFTSSDVFFKINATLFHKIPGYFLDLMNVIIGKKARLVRMYEKVNRAFACLEYFTLRQWRFISNNPFHLMEKMSLEDRQIFYFDVRDIDWQHYFDVYIQGTRRFILKDDMSSLPEARKNLNRLYVVKQLFRLFLIGLTIFAFLLINNLYDDEDVSIEKLI